MIALPRLFQVLSSSRHPSDSMQEPHIQLTRSSGELTLFL